MILCFFWNISDPSLKWQVEKLVRKWTVPFESENRLLFAIASVWVDSSERRVGQSNSFEGTHVMQKSHFSHRRRAAVEILQLAPKLIFDQL